MRVRVQAARTGVLEKGDESSVAPPIALEQRVAVLGVEVLEDVDEEERVGHSDSIPTPSRVPKPRPFRTA